MKTELKILYIEDNPDDVALTERMLVKAGLQFRMEVSESETSFIDALNHFDPDLVLSDHSLPGFNSNEAFRITNEKKPGTPFILLTGTVSEQFAVDSLLAGIDDYILKTSLVRLPSAINRVLAKKKITQEKETIELLHLELQKAYRVIALKNKEITDSINYAKRIQNAVLPGKDRFNKEFRSGFVIYQPRDIVSGDLYWFAKTSSLNEAGRYLKVVAAIDCTGHGVPGAFMSLLVSGLLGRILKNKKIHFPGEVLSFLNKKLPESLNKNNQERITDGLDIALCFIDQATRTIYFAGANRALWLLKKHNGIYYVLEYRGTKASIGSNTSPRQEFQTGKINVEKGDRIFLFTDGITDQFGGPIEKKLGKKKLRDLIVNSAQLEMRYQKKYILAFIADWKGRLDQVDDIMLIGLEMD